MSHKKAKRARKLAGRPIPKPWEKSCMDDIAAASREGRETCGRLPGFVRFVHRLSGDTLRWIGTDFKMLVLAASHATALMYGDPNDNFGFRADLMDNNAIQHVKRALAAEHFRRIGLLRIRHPRDPIRQDVTVAIRTNHPFARTVEMVDDDTRRRLFEQVIDQGNLFPLLPYFSKTLTRKEQGEMMDQLELMESEWQSPYDPDLPQANRHRPPFAKNAREELLDHLQELREHLAFARDQLEPDKYRELRKALLNLHENFRVEICKIEQTTNDRLERFLQQTLLKYTEPAGPTQ